MPAAVRRAAHHAVQRVDLAHDVALAEAADRRVARHLADAVEAMRDQRRARAHAVRRQRGLGAGMAAADHDDVEAAMFHVKQSLLAEAEALRRHVEHGLYIHLADQEIKRAQRRAAAPPRRAPAAARPARAAARPR